MKHPRWQIVWGETDDITLTIRDMGPWDVYPTVTNDVEHVVEYLHNMGVLHGGRRLLYYDSEGHLDQIVHANGKFVAFNLMPL